MIRNKILITLLTAASLALGMGAAVAGEHHYGEAFHGRHAKGFSPEDLKHRIETRQNRLHEALKLTEQQEAAWKTFIQNITPKQTSGQDGERSDPKAAGKLTTPERLEKLLAFAKKREAFLSERLDAVKSFYAVLTQEQKKTFDAFHSFANNRGHTRFRRSCRGRR